MGVSISGLTTPKAGLPANLARIVLLLVIEEKLLNTAPDILEILG